MNAMKYGAVIVAAGMTDRLKRYKQLMNISSKSIAERVIVNFKRAGIEDIIMITGHNADKLEKALKNFDITFIRNLIKKGVGIEKNAYICTLKSTRVVVRCEESICIGLPFKVRQILKPKDRNTDAFCFLLMYWPCATAYWSIG